MRIIQFLDVEGTRRVGIVRDAETIEVLTGEQTARDLALEAIRNQRSLAQVLSERTSDRRLDYAGLVEERRILAPIDHTDPAHTLITGTGLTHLGSADARDRMQWRISAGQQRNAAGETPAAFLASG